MACLRSIYVREECRLKLAGPGDREAAIRAPLEGLLRAVGDHLGVPAVFHDEVRDAERRVRPDYGVSIGGAISGYVEVKAPGHPLDPDRLPVTTSSNGNANETSPT